MSLSSGSARRRTAGTWGSDRRTGWDAGDRPSPELRGRGGWAPLGAGAGDHGSTWRLPKTLSSDGPRDPIIPLAAGYLSLGQCEPGPGRDACTGAHSAFVL